MSLEEFLESCRHTSLLTELEDEEELPDAEDDDPNDENDDEVSIKGGQMIYGFLQLQREIWKVLATNK